MNELQKYEPQEVARPLDVSAMFSEAMKMGKDGVEIIRELVTLRREEEARQAEREFNSAMTLAQQEMPEVVKDAKNPSTNSMFARLETIERVAKKIYQKHGFSLQFSQVDCSNPNLMRISCKVLHAGGHSAMHTIDLSPDDVGMKGSPTKTKVHGQGSTFSYGKRYLTAGIFNITIVGADNDAGGPRQHGPGNKPPVEDVKAIKTRLWALLASVRGAAQSWDIAESWLAQQKIIDKGERVSAMTAEELQKVFENADLTINPPGDV